MIDNMYPQIPEGETEEQFWKRMKEKMAKTPMQFVKTETMKERQYENTLYWILGVLDSNTELNADTMSVIETKIREVLKDTEKPQTLIRG